MMFLFLKQKLLCISQL